MATCSKPAVRSRGLLALAFAAAAVHQTLNFVAPRQGALTASTRDASALRGRVARAARGGADDDEDDIEFYSEVDVATLKQGQELEAVVTRIVPFGAFVDFGADDGVEGLVPTSKLQDGRTENVEDVVSVGDTVKCWVVEVKGPRKVTLSMSQRKVFAPQPRAPKADAGLFEPLVGGDFVEGTVVSVQNFGAFVELPAPEGEAKGQGLVHITQIKDGFTRNVADEVSVGQKVKVKVIGVNADKNQIQLSMKGAPRPKNDVSGFAALTDEEWLEGSVKSLANYGAFVEVAAPGGGLPVQGLVHISQIQEGFLEDPAEALEVGMDVKVRVIEVDTEQGKVGLSMKQKAAAKEAVAA